MGDQARIPGAALELPGRAAPAMGLYDTDAEDLAAAGPLTEVRPVGDWPGEDQQPWVEPQPGQVRQLKDDGQVVDGDW